MCQHRKSQLSAFLVLYAVLGELVHYLVLVLVLQYVGTAVLVRMHLKPPTPNKCIIIYKLIGTLNKNM